MSIKLEPGSKDKNKINKFDHKEKYKLLKLLKQAEGNPVQLMQHYPLDDENTIRGDKPYIFRQKIFSFKNLLFI